MKDYKEPLINALKDEDECVRIGQQGALRKIGDSRALKLLIETLMDEYEDVRSRAADALDKIGPWKSFDDF